MIALLAASALAMAVADEAHQHEHSPKLGQLTFQSTCNPAAHTQVVRGLSWLHSFEYREAARAFGEAAETDPACGIAFWGVAMSYYHPLWDAPTAAELEQGTAALAKAHEANARSQRERDYITALGAFYGDASRVDHKTRVLAYNSAMADLYRRYPADNEAAVFYALSLIAAGTLDNDPSFSREKEAGAILNHVLAQEPDHPGVAHYLIHCFDYPALAELALPAARRYADIAPDSAHAQHMPSHIFTRLGLWDASIKSNSRAEAAARAYGKAQGMPGAWDQQLHAMDYLAYAYLQTGRDAEAEQVLNELKAISDADPPKATVAYAVTAIPARVMLERRQWREAASLTLPSNLAALPALANRNWAAANIHFARAVGAARSGNARVAREEVAKLTQLEQSMTVPPGEYDWRTQVSIQRQIAYAWLALQEHRETDALASMRAAADLDDAAEKSPVTPGSILPAREELGALLLELNRPAAALKEYKASLTRAPRRLAGVYGAARAAQLAGSADEARRYYAELIEITKGGNPALAEVKEARAFLARYAQRWVQPTFAR
jgi:tetratricopeptide (TPR) repeat protein